MSRWNDPAAWRGLCDGSSCPVCLRGIALDTIATMEAAWLAMAERAPMPGYACLVSRVHAVELHDLTVAQAEAFMRDVRRTSAAVSAATGAVKLNLEIHGNTLPHLHVHVFPRYIGDRFERGPIDPSQVSEPVYTGNGFAEMRHRILRALESEVT